MKWALGVGFALLLAAWVVGTQPFDSPDEASHYLRAMTIADGHLVGTRMNFKPKPVGVSAAQLAWIEKGTTAVWVPPGLAPGGVFCLDGLLDTRGCNEATEAGNYQPLPYLLPGLAIAVSDTAYTALWRSRAVSAALCLVFLLLAVVLLWDGAVVSLLGLSVAVSPMVLFVCSILNPNGLEVAASLAFAAAIVRLARDPERTTRGVWAAFAAAGAAVVLSWQLGPVFAGASLAIGLLLVGRRGALDLWRGARRAVLSAFGVLAVALALFVIYGLASGLLHSNFHISPIGLGLRLGWDQLGAVLKDAVGNFGILSIPLPMAVRWVWWLLALALIGGALWLGTNAERRLMAAVSVLALAFPVLLYAWSYRFTGFGMQGRYVLPILCGVPLLAGEIVRRHWDVVADSAVGRLVPAAVLTVVAIVQVYAWWYDASHVAGTPGKLRFYSGAGWSPPGGWVIWIIAALGGAAAMLVCAGAAMRRTRVRVHA